MKIRREERQGVALVVLIGQLTENDSLEGLIGPVRDQLLINCRHIARINSVGTKSWILYFQALRKQGVKLTFEEVSPALARQANLIINFIHAEEVESVCLPYHCGTCDAETDTPVSVQVLRASGLPASPRPCAMCRADSTVDLEQDGLAFLAIAGS